MEVGVGLVDERILVACGREFRSRVIEVVVGGVTGSPWQSGFAGWGCRSDDPGRDRAVATCVKVRGVL